MLDLCLPKLCQLLVSVPWICFFCSSLLFSVLFAPCFFYLVHFFAMFVFSKYCCIQTVEDTVQLGIRATVYVSINRKEKNRKRIENNIIMCLIYFILAF